MEVVLPVMTGAERAAWHLVLDLAEARLPRWVLAGGLMVHLHLYEAGAAPHRVTTDIDAVVDVRVGARRATEEFSHRIQTELGLRLETPGSDGVAHRFIRGDGAVVDVLAADFGPRGRPHTTIPPGRTVEVPGGRRLLESAAAVRVHHDGRSAVIERPSLIAAIIGKCQAFTDVATAVGDPDRHLRDAAMLLTLLDPAVVRLSRADRGRVRRLQREIEARPALAGDDRDLVLDTLALLVGRSDHS